MTKIVIKPKQKKSVKKIKISSNSKMKKNGYNKFVRYHKNVVMSYNLDDNDYVIVRHSRNKGWFCKKTNLVGVKKLLKSSIKNRKKDNRKRNCFLECIRAFRKRKLYFDLDEVDQVVIDKVKLKIKEILPTAEFSISGNMKYNKDKNCSFPCQHIIVNNYYFTSNQHIIESGFIDWFKKIKIDLGFTEEKLQELKDKGIEEKTRKYHCWGLDISVYPTKTTDNNNEYKSVINKSVKQMKLIHSSKPDEDRFQDIIEDNNELNHLIQYIPNNCKEVGFEFKEYFVDKFVETKIYEEKKKKLFNWREFIKTLPKSEIETKTYDPSLFNNNMDVDGANQTYSILKLFDNTLIYPNFFYKLIYKFFKGRGLKFKTIYKYFEKAFPKNNHKPIDSISRWKKIWDEQQIECSKGTSHIDIQENNEIVTDRYDDLIEYNDSNMSSKIKCILESTYTNFINKWNNDYREAIDIKIDVSIKGQYTKKEHLMGEDVVNNNSVLGGGKTYAVGQYCRKAMDHWNQGKDFDVLKAEQRPLRILILSSKISLSYDLQGSFNNKHKLNFHHYKDVKCDKQYENTPMESINRGENMKEFDEFVCSIHSLHYLDNQDDYYDIVVCDEIKDLWMAFNNKTCMKHYEKHDKYDKNYMMFCKIIRESKKLFFMDGIMPSVINKWINIIRPNSSIKTIKKIGGINRNVHLIKKNKIEPIFKRIIDKVKNNKKIYIYYPFAGDNGMYKLSIDNFGRKIAHFGGIDFNDILIIKASTDQQLKSQMKDVNKLWSKYKIILVNSAITIGVSYEIKDVDSVFLCWADFIPCSDIVQTSVRCRKLLTNEVYIWNIPSIDSLNNIDRNPNSWIPKLTNYYDDDTIEKSFAIMSKFLRKEHKANNWNTLIHLFKITGHDIIKDYEIEYEEDFGDSLKEWRDNNKESSFDWSQVNLIDNKTSYKLKKKQGDNKLKEMEIWELLKYNIKRMFKEDTEEKILARFYKKHNLLRAMKLLTYVPMDGIKDDEQEILKYAYKEVIDPINGCKSYIMRSDDLSVMDIDKLKKSLGMTKRQCKTANPIVIRKYINRHFFGTDNYMKIEKDIHKFCVNSKRCSLKIEDIGECLIEDFKEKVEEITKKENEIWKVNEYDTSTEISNLGNLRLIKKKKKVNNPITNYL